jgi:hypothetical protein
VGIHHDVTEADYYAIILHPSLMITALLWSARDADEMLSAKCVRCYTRVVSQKYSFPLLRIVLFDMVKFLKRFKDFSEILANFLFNIGKIIT